MKPISRKFFSCCAVTDRRGLRLWFMAQKQKVNFSAAKVDAAKIFQLAPDILPPVMLPQKN